MFMLEILQGANDIKQTGQSKPENPVTFKHYTYNSICCKKTEG